MNVDVLWMKNLKHKTGKDKNIFQQVVSYHAEFPSLEVQVLQLLTFLLFLLGSFFLADMFLGNQNFVAVVASSYVAIFCFYDVGAGGVLGLLLLLVSLVKEATEFKQKGSAEPVHSLSSASLWFMVTAFSFYFLFLNPMKRCVCSQLKLSSAVEAANTLSSFTFSLILGLLLHIGYKPKLRDSILVAAAKDSSKEF